jgi:hypothetical protein
MTIRIPSIAALCLLACAVQASHSASAKPRPFAAR